MQYAITGEIIAITADISLSIRMDNTLDNINETNSEIQHAEKRMFNALMRSSFSISFSLLTLIAGQ